MILTINFNSYMHCRPTFLLSFPAKGSADWVITKGSQHTMKQGIRKQSIQ